jgi:hypothetical protein
MSDKWNYFNYFTEVEEHFQSARRTGLFLMSPLDWALVESWKNAGIPLEAVLRGIDAAFEKWHARKQKSQHVNSLAYCSQAILKEAQLLDAPPPPASVEAPFSLDDLRAFLESNAVQILAADPAFHPVATRLRELAADAPAHFADLHSLEQILSTLEEKLTAIARARQSDEALLAARVQLDSELRPYRGKMSAEQLAMLERQYLDRIVQQQAGLPRLSLFHLSL